MHPVTLYIASSFRHVHGVRLLSRELRRLGYEVFDWTEEATPPEGLSVAERRIWMDTDHGGEVFGFCAMACRTADLVVYMGASGQDAGVEVGMARASGVPILGVRGPLESPGLMLYGAVDAWVESIDLALAILAEIPAALERSNPGTAQEKRQAAVRELLRKATASGVR